MACGAFNGKILIGNKLHDETSYINNQYLLKRSINDRSPLRRRISCNPSDPEARPVHQRPPLILRPLDGTKHHHHLEVLAGRPDGSTRVGNDHLVDDDLRAGPQSRRQVLKNLDRLVVGPVVQDRPEVVVGSALSIKPMLVVTETDKFRGTRF